MVAMRLPPVSPLSAPRSSDRLTALMPFFNHLLCLIAETPPSSAALQQATALADAFGATLDVGRLDGVPPQAVDAALHAVEELDAGPPMADRWESHASPDGAIDALANYVQETNVDLIVTDTPADRGPIPLLAASPLQPLVHRLNCSLLVVEQQTPLPAPDRILVPTDLSPSSRTALECAAALAAPHHTSIDLLHVLETVPYVALTRLDRLSFSHTSFPERRARRQMEAFLDDGVAPPLAVTPHVEYGDPADQIGRFLHRHPTDLMILGAHGTSTAPPPLGPVADRVLRRVTCPLLLLRAPSSRTLPITAGPPH